MYDKKLIMTIAHLLNTEENDLGHCLRQTWAAYKLVLRMEDATTSFKYIKGDGTLREAVGRIYGELEKPMSARRRTVLYDDLETGTVRSFRIDRLVTA